MGKFCVKSVSSLCCRSWATSLRRFWHPVEIMSNVGVDSRLNIGNRCITSLFTRLTFQSYWFLYIYGSKDIQYVKHTVLRFVSRVVKRVLAADRSNAKNRPRLFARTLVARIRFGADLAQSEQWSTTIPDASVMSVTPAPADEPKFATRIVSDPSVASVVRVDLNANLF